MGDSISTANIQQQAEAKAALSDMCESVARAILAVAKLEGPLQSEEVVADAAKEVLNVCQNQAQRAAGELTQIIRREKLSRVVRAAGANVAPGLQNMQADLLFLELLRVALDDSSGECSGASSSGSGSGSPRGTVTNSREVSIAHPWTKKELLGKGAFGSVYSAVDKKGLRFAVKEVSRDGVEEKSIRDEVKILGQLSHENVVKFYGCAGDKEKIYMYMELMQGSVKDKMNKSGMPIPENTAKKYTKDVLQGLLYLHGKDIVHCDIKSANVLLTSSGTAKLADMGISRKHDHTTMLQTTGALAGTLLWMSPEQISGCQSGKRSDVWSLGCTVYEMVTGAPPFEKELSPILYALVLPKMISNLEHRKLVQSNDSIGPSLQSFLLKIFVKMDERPFADEVADHPWLR